MTQLNALRHGHTGNGSASPTYDSWAHMIQRCTNPSNKDYARYGGRGITVCDRWLRFDHFLADMGARASGLTLDRIDPDRGYSPNNCRWATRKQQSENQKRTIWIEARGLRLTICQWAPVIGVSRATMLRRYAAGDRDEILLRPPRPGWDAQRQCYTASGKRYPNRARPQTAMP